MQSDGMKKKRSERGKSYLKETTKENCVFVNHVFSPSHFMWFIALGDGKCEWKLWYLTNLLSELIGDQSIYQR